MTQPRLQDLLRAWQETPQQDRAAIFAAIHRLAGFALQQGHPEFVQSLHAAVNLLAFAAKTSAEHWNTHAEPT